MFMRRIYDEKLAQTAYLIGCQRSGEAIIIDPERDVDRYIKLANENDLRIIATAETHIHADFLSGSRELAESIGAKVYVSDEGGVDWKYQWLDSTKCREISTCSSTVGRAHDRGGPAPIWSGSAMRSRIYEVGSWPGIRRMWPQNVSQRRKREMSQSSTTHAKSVIDVTPDLLECWLQAGDTVVIDVREDFETATEYIPGSHHFALSRLEPRAIRDAYGERRVVFHCRTGRRSAVAAERYRSNDDHTFHLAGGLEAWKATGRDTARSASAPRVDVMRQVQMTAGSLVVAGVMLGFFVSPWFLALSGFVGAGLLFAGASGWCGLAMLLSRMPWNREVNFTSREES